MRRVERSQCSNESLFHFVPLAFGGEELVTVNPGLVLGPILTPDFSTSGEVVRKLLKRDLPGCPDIGWAIVDVRDVADAHIAALKAPGAAGQRFVVAIEHASMSDIAAILAAKYNGRGYRVPKGWRNSPASAPPTPRLC